MAKKYFGRIDAMGESLKIEGNLYQVTAIMKDLPYNTHLKFNTLLSHITLPTMYQWYKEDSFNGNNEYTYLEVEPGTDLATFNSKLVTFAESLKDKIGTERFVAEPIKDIHLYSNKSFEPEVNGSAKTVYALLIIAIFIIVIAWVNYINLSTARAIERAKEVGIRKVMGSLRTQLVFQFLAESAIINVIAAGTRICVLPDRTTPLSKSDRTAIDGGIYNQYFFLVFIPGDDGCGDFAIRNLSSRRFIFL